MELWRQLAEAVAANPWRILYAIGDVLLVVLFAWRLFMILRGTKGVAFLNVLAVLFVLQVVSAGLPLPFFSRLLQLLSPMLLVAFPVVFQPELRRALEQLGRRNFLRRLFLGSRPEEARSISAIVQACAAMAENRVGGLIVLERDQDLNEIAATGIRLDATIGPELIGQVFATHGPLHDGAILVKGQRILAAACLLPLSDRDDLGTRIGTRHRAGLGMAEASDAVVIIVSEERGTITLAVEGRLELGLTPESLSLRLADLLLENGRQRPAGDLRRRIQRGRAAGR